LVINNALVTTPAIRQIIVAVGAIEKRWSRPIPRKTPPSVGRKALQVVSRAVMNISIGPLKPDCSLVVRPGFDCGRGDVVIWAYSNRIIESAQAGEFRQH
jgi:hypothetical protein